MAASSTTWTKSPSRSRSMLAGVVAKVGALIEWRCPYGIGFISLNIYWVVSAGSVVGTGDLSHAAADLGVGVAHADYFRTRKRYEGHTSRRFAELPGLLLDIILGLARLAQRPAQGQNDGLLIHHL